MVTYRFLYDRWIKPQRERLQQEAREQARAEVRAEIAAARADAAVARAEHQRLWEDWLRRLEEAERHNLPFHEAPPQIDCIDVAPDK